MDAEDVCCPGGEGDAGSDRLIPISTATPSFRMVYFNTLLFFFFSVVVLHRLLSREFLFKKKPDGNARHIMFMDG